jgi:hypothetical protein
VVAIVDEFDVGVPRLPTAAGTKRRSLSGGLIAGTVTAADGCHEVNFL